ncbi:MAG TPA: COX15/CtaA family protein [Byssovorax sp.]|jgi:heme A synthase
MLHRFAQLTAIATYVLLLVGGLVHGTGSSLACPDWPLCHGQVFPAMEHGVEYEHSHRLVAAAVSVLTVALAVWLFVDKRDRSLRPLAVAAPLMVFAQALLGGLTVIFKLPRFITLSHLTLSMCFFSVTVVVALRTRESPPTMPRADRGTRTIVGAAAASVLGQILLGGFVRHSMAGLACLTFPLCFGHVWPPESTSSGSERLHMLHRFGAVLVAAMVVWAAVRVLRHLRDGAGDARSARRLAKALPAIVLVQITLGVLSVTTLLHLPVVETHLAVGALLLGTLVALWTRLGAYAALPVVTEGAASPAASVPA